jgi:hypothetical protein
MHAAEHSSSKSRRSEAWNHAILGLLPFWLPGQPARARSTATGDDGLLPRGG